MPILRGQAAVVSAALVFLAVGVHNSDGQGIDNCLRRSPGSPDCARLTAPCLLNGRPFSDPSPNHRVCYRTCYTPSPTGRCLGKVIIPNITIQPYFHTRFITSYKLTSPRYRKGSYRGSTECRSHIACPSGWLLDYRVINQQVQNRVQCFGSCNRCVDIVRFRIPGLGKCERCGSINDPLSAPCPSRSGQTNRMFFDFISNREVDHSGVEVLVNCIDPMFDRNGVSMMKRQTQQETCINLDGSPPRNAPPIPSPAARIQEVRARDPNATYLILEGPEDVLMFNNSVISLTRATGGVEHFPGIQSIVVESPFDLRRYGRIAPGMFIGFAQLVISGAEAAMVQYGSNPNLRPTPEEAAAASMIDSVVADSIEDFDQFDVFDEMDELEQILPVVTNSQTLEVTRSKRGVDADFLNQLALEYENSCNGVLRASSCVYQAVVMGINCTI